MGLIDKEVNVDQTVSTRKTTATPLTKAVTRYIKSPKGILLVVLGLLSAVAMAAVGLPRALPEVASAMLVAAVTDVALAVWLRDEWIFPSGALLTGLILALVLGPETSPYVAGLSAALAIASKYVFRTKWSNVFNPAALALVVSYVLFGTGESWWGSLPDLPPIALILVVAAGVFIADRVNKLPMALTFLAAFYALATATSSLGHPALVQEVFRTPDANAALFLALFMLDDPPTSPVRYGDQVMFGVIAATASITVYLFLGGVYYLAAGVLVANLWETMRRLEERKPSKSGEAKPPLRVLSESLTSARSGS
jgi:Na+-translocating ferredoxin:NAD+ oxidoreductase RnfD subunit